MDLKQTDTGVYDVIENLTIYGKCHVDIESKIESRIEISENTCENFGTKDSGIKHSDIGVCSR